MALIATVAVRPFARFAAAMPPAISICDNTQPPKISPEPLVSAGKGTVCRVNSPCGVSVMKAGPGFQKRYARLADLAGRVKGAQGTGQHRNEKPRAGPRGV